MEFARRAGGQVVTDLLCGRSCPDPLGIVLWFDKLEFFEFPVIASQCSHWRGNLLDRRTISRGRIPENGTKRAVCMTMVGMEFDGDSHASVRTGSE